MNHLRCGECGSARVIQVSIRAGTVQLVDAMSSPEVDRKIIDMIRDNSDDVKRILAGEDPE